MNTTKCKSCKAPIFYAQNVKSGRPMCLNPVPTQVGNVVISEGTGAPLCTVLTKREMEMKRWQTEARYLDHHATCPGADAWRKTVRRTDPATAAWLAEQEAKHGVRVR